MVSGVLGLGIIAVSTGGLGLAAGVGVAAAGSATGVAVAAASKKALDNARNNRQVFLIIVLYITKVHKRSLPCSTFNIKAAHMLRNSLFECELT